MKTIELGWFRTRVVGTQYYKVGHVPGQLLHFERNHHNRHDANAIEAQNGKGQVLGHLPRQDSAWLAPLIDRGSIYLKGESDDAGDEWQIPVRVSVHQDPGGPLILGPRPPDPPGEVIHHHLQSVYQTAFSLTAKVLQGILTLYAPMIEGDDHQAGRRPGNARSLGCAPRRCRRDRKGRRGVRRGSGGGLYHLLRRRNQ